MCAGGWAGVGRPRIEAHRVLLGEPQRVCISIFLNTHAILAFVAATVAPLRVVVLPSQTLFITSPPSPRALALGEGRCDDPEVVASPMSSHAVVWWVCRRKRGTKIVARKGFVWTAPRQLPNLAAKNARNGGGAP